MKTTSKSQQTQQTNTPAEAPSQPRSAEGAPERRRFKEVWLVEDRKEGKAMWTRVGTAFENSDGSWNLRLSALPIAATGRLNVRDPLPVERAGREAVAA